MNKIISISLPDQTLNQIDLLQEQANYTGRSQIIRAGINALLAEHKQITTSKGVVDAVLLVIHSDHYTREIAEIYHKNESIIKTQLHNHLENHNCLEIFVLRAPARQIQQMLNELNTSKKVTVAKLIIA